jgi:hypothetical protein
MKTPVSVSMIDAILAQTELLNLVREYVPTISREVLGKDAAASEHFRNTPRYRSILLTFEVEKSDRRKGKFPYGWHIYYNNPTILVFAKKVNTTWVECAPPLDLEKEFYFQLDDKKKRKMVSDFVRKSLQVIK